MEHSLSENVFKCKYTPYREIRPNNFAFAQGAQARHPSARKSGRNSLDELPINSRNIVCIRKFEQQPSFAYLCALVLSAQFYAELLPSLRYSTFLCECFRLACPVNALRARMRTKHWETACSFLVEFRLPEVYERRQVFSPLVVLSWRARDHRMPAQKESDAAILYSVWWFNAKASRLYWAWYYHWGFFFEMCCS